MQMEKIEDITGITCIHIPVSDVFNSIQWYRNNLGCMPTNHNPIEPGMGQSILRFPNQDGTIDDAGLRATVPALILMKVDDSAGCLGFTLESGKKQPIACFITPRLQEMHSRFIENEVSIETLKLDESYLEFCDPDRNMLAIWQPD